MKKIFLVSAFVYLFLAPFYFHPDIKTIYYLAHFLSDGVLNIYDFIAQNPDKSSLGSFVYPPLAYYIFGVLYFPIKFFAGSGFLNWLGMGNDAVLIPNIFRYIFLLKLPLILVHIATGLLLVKTVEEKLRNKVALLWFFNPISLYVIAFMGQFDVIPVFFTVLSLLLSKRNPYLAAIALGLGGAIKTYPLLLLPFLAITSYKNTKQQMLTLIVGIMPYVLFIGPFLKTSAFYSDTLASGLSQRILQFGLPLGFGEQILIFPALFLALIFFCFSKSMGKSDHLLNYFLTVLLLIVASTHFHPQWALWAVPFVCLAAQNLRLVSWFLFVGFLGTALMFDDKFLTFGLLSPLDAGVFFLPSLSEIIRKVYDPLLVQSIFHTMLAVSAIWIASGVFKRQINESKN